ncbi:MAG: putative lipid-binding transport protein (Tim44 family) [Brevundimonas sp.]|uniref:TIM44-related membrane protein TimA n=1 Tax=Brevundimonas sp. TaxID=1871086 RepID=UPI0024873D04|nr:TIM44-related membrane protein TimA [Brevundimonas sp.]MDI1280314.1 TIM44-related membrane protein TimA [Brevundimonas sp.]
MPVPILLIVSAVVALFVLFQLYNVLGKKIGRQPEDNVRALPKVGAAPAPAGTADAGSRSPALDAAALVAISGLKAREPGFDPSRFLEGARQAHESIVRAYAAGDRETLKPLLTEAVMQSFESGIAAREARGEVEQAEFIHPPRADLELATVEGDRAVAKVRFLAELRNRVTPDGGEEQVEERRTAEHWTFERALGAEDPNWVLARVEPASA